MRQKTKGVNVFAIAILHSHRLSVDAMTEIPLGLTSTFILGLLHSMEPSHAKATLAAYFLNQKRTAMEAVAFAVTVTLAHTLVIYALALTGYALGPLFSNEAVERWSKLFGGVLMAGMGVWMFWSERNAGFHKGGSPEPASFYGHFFHHHPCHDDHAAPSSWRQIFLLGFCSGMIPCMTGLTILVLAWTTTTLFYGLALVTVFSIGMGLVVLVMCLLMQQMARVMDVYWEKSARWIRFLPVLSSLLIILMGAFVATQGLPDFFQTKGNGR